MKLPVATGYWRGHPHIRVWWPRRKYHEYYSLTGWCAHRSHRLNLRCYREMTYQSACGKHQDCNWSLTCPTFGPGNREAS